MNSRIALPQLETFCTKTVQDLIEVNQDYYFKIAKRNGEYFCFGLNNKELNITDGIVISAEPVKGDFAIESLHSQYRLSVVGSWSGDNNDFMPRTVYGFNAVLIYMEEMISKLRDIDTAKIYALSEDKNLKDHFEQMATDLTEEYDLQGIFTWHEDFKQGKYTYKTLSCHIEDETAFLSIGGRLIVMPYDRIDREILKLASVFS